MSVGMPLQVEFNNIILRIKLYGCGVQIGGDSGTGKTFLFEALSGLDELLPSEVRSCIAYKRPIEHVIFINRKTLDPVAAMKQFNNSLIFIDNADVVFSQHPELADWDPEGLALYYIIFSRGGRMPSFAYNRVQLRFDRSEGVFETYE